MPLIPHIRFLNDLNLIFETTLINNIGILIILIPGIENVINLKLYIKIFYKEYF